MILTLIWIIGYCVCLCYMTNETFKQDVIIHADIISDIVLSALLWPIILLSAICEVYTSGENNNDNFEREQY